MMETPDWLIALAMLCCVRLPLEILKWLGSAEPRDWPEP